MRALIVYESVFGNTREVAEAIEEGIRAADPTADVACIPVTDTGARPVEAPDLLVLGGPTHMGGMSRGFTRSMGLRIESATQKAKRKERLRQRQAPLPQSQRRPCRRA
jgi:flavorubredoxin